MAARKHQKMTPELERAIRARKVKSPKETQREIAANFNVPVADVSAALKGGT